MIVFAMVRRGATDVELHFTKSDSIEKALDAMGINKKELCLVGTITEKLYHNVEAGNWITMAQLGRHN